MYFRSERLPHKAKMELDILLLNMMLKLNYMKYLAGAAQSLALALLLSGMRCHLSSQFNIANNTLN